MRRATIFIPLLVVYLALTLASPGFAPTGDEHVYVRYAERIDHGRYSDAAVSDADYLWYGPGLPGLLAPLTAAGAPLPVLRSLCALFVFLAVLAFDALLRRSMGPRQAALGAYALGLYVPLWLLLPHIYSEPLALLGIVSGMLFTARALGPDRSRLDVPLGGLSFALVAMTRVGFGPIVTALLVLFAARALYRRLRGRPAGAATRVAAVFGVALVLCVPWLAFTYSKTGHVYYWGNSGGLNLYWIASPYPGDLGEWRPVNDPTRPEHARFFASLRHLGPVNRDLALQRRARMWIREHPASYVGNVLPNLSRILFGAPYIKQGDQPLRPLIYGLPNALLVGALALCAPLLLRRRRELPAEAGAFVAFAVVTFLLHLALAADARMFIPVVPVVIWLVAVAVTRFVNVGQAAATSEPTSGRASEAAAARA